MKRQDLERLARKFGGRVQKETIDGDLNIIFPTYVEREKFEQALTEWRKDDDRASTLQAD